MQKNFGYFLVPSVFFAYKLRTFISSVNDESAENIHTYKLFVRTNTVGYFFYDM